ncbi:MAG: sulfotransferase [Chloroflexi bacterium]|nr:sulfotransferase [Chloroflexota bacterium]
MDTLLGITAHDWWELLRENKFAVSPRYAGRAAIVTAVSMTNSAARKREMSLHGAQIATTQVEAPLFILGFWRSGTTLLYNLLAQDERFAFPTLFQVSNPHTFLLRDTESDPAANGQPQKRPMDNMTVTADSPGEDEFATAVMSLRSPLLGWAFPRNESRYDRYITFADAPEGDAARWEAALTWFLQKLSCVYQRPLLLKSPPHTGRIQRLLKLFPDARFVHIHRNPFTVFQSTRRLYRTAVPRSHLQQPDETAVNDHILQRYRQIYDAYFAEKTAVPTNQLCEISFEALEQDTMGQIYKIYETLNLGMSPKLEQRLSNYVNSLDGYKKNHHAPLTDELRRQITQIWQPVFEEWDYAY